MGTFHWTAETGNRKQKGTAFRGKPDIRGESFLEGAIIPGCALAEHGEGGGDRSEGRAMAATGGLQISPGFPLSLSTVRKDLEQQSAPSLRRNTKVCTLVEAAPTPKPRVSRLLVSLRARAFRLSLRRPT